MIHECMRIDRQVAPVCWKCTGIVGHCSQHGARQLSLTLIQSVRLHQNTLPRCSSTRAGGSHVKYKGLKQFIALSVISSAAVLAATAVACLRCVFEPVHRGDEHTLCQLSSPLALC